MLNVLLFFSCAEPRNCEFKLSVICYFLSCNINSFAKATSFMLTKETPKGHVALTSTICRNFEFYQYDTKIRRKLAYEMYSCVQLLGGFAPDPLTRGSAPGPCWEHSPQTPIIGSRYRARHSPPMLKPNSAYGDGREGRERKGE